MDRALTDAHPMNQKDSPRGAGLNFRSLNLFGGDQKNSLFLATNFLQTKTYLHSLFHSKILHLTFKPNKCNECNSFLQK